MSGTGRVAGSSLPAFLTRLAAEPEIARRADLSRLLLEEAAKYKDTADCVKDMDAYIAKCNVQIARHQALLDCGANQDLVQNVLENMAAIKSRLQIARKTMAYRSRGLKGH